MSAQCLDLRGSEQDSIINETWNNAIICVNPNTSLVLQLKDSSRTGRQWQITASPGLQFEDRGVTWYDEPGVPPVSLIEFGIHEWKVSIKDTGVQTIKATLQFPGRDVTGKGDVFNLTLVVS